MLNELNLKNISMTVDLLKKNKIRYIVISPGGTNIPFVKMVQDDPFFMCYSVVDERSAMYFAIGLHLSTGEIIVTSCTSAQATRNYIPGLTEAYYKKVPILAITMQKHPRFTYQDYMQAPDQTSLPKDSVKHSYQLPYISDNNDLLYSMRLINEAILELTHNGNGPVQLCIPWLDFPLASDQFNLKSIKRYTPEATDTQLALIGKKILIVIGEHRPFSNKQCELIENFCAQYNVCVYTNHLSNYNGKYSVNANLLLTSMKMEQLQDLKPDVILSFGGQTGDYPLYKFLYKLNADEVEHWRISEDGAVVDTYDKLTRVYQCDIEQFFLGFTNKSNSDHSYYEKWEALKKVENIHIDVPFSNAYAAQKLHSMIPNNSFLNFAILNSLRVWNLLEIHPSIQCYSNVGAFGIDGGLSTLIGESITTDQMCFMITGDLAFYYDMNCLAIRHIKNNVRILLVNNNGGIEFKLQNKDNQSIDRYIAASDHFQNARGWAETCGFKYLSAKTKNELDALLQKFVQKSDKPIILEMFVSDRDDAIAYKTIVEANTFKEPKDILKSSIKTIAKKFWG